MPLPQVQLDDWTYEELVREGLATLPSHAPDWTNFNAADPGITFMELFAYFTEALIFQTGQTPSGTQLAFQRLLSAGGPAADQSVEDAMQDALQALNRRERAVSCSDYEELAVRADTRVARAKCVPLLNLTERNEAARKASRPGHVSVVLVFTSELDATAAGDCVDAVKRYLDPRRILTTRVHVVQARRVNFEVRLRLYATAGVSAEMAVKDAQVALRTFFDATEGGLDGDGWRMGRDVYMSSVYLVLSRLSTVDHVEQEADERTGVKTPELAVDAAEADRLYRDGAGDLIGLRLAPDELPGEVTLSLTGNRTVEDESRNL